jgi:hypothetical protein
MFGPYAAWADELAWQYRPVFDLSGCCSDDFANGNQFFVLARAVVGYQAKPTPMILILYVAYWVAVITAVIIKWRNGSLFDADYKRKRAHLRLSRRADGAAKRLARCVCFGGRGGTMAMPVWGESSSAAAYCNSATHSLAAAAASSFPAAATQVQPQHHWARGQARNCSSCRRRHSSPRAEAHRRTLTADAARGCSSRHSSSA